MMFDPNVIMLASLAFLLVAGVPIAVSLCLAAVLGILTGLDIYALATVGTNTYNGIAKYPLIAIPLFILTGMIFERSGVAAKLVTFATAVVGPRRGGLAVVAVLVCLLMGGMSGSGPADAAAVATVMIPSMMKAGYPKSFSAGVIASSASTAILIPPSIALIIYSIMVPGMDLRALFAAGLIPGLMAGMAIIIPTILLSRKHGFGVLETDDRPPFWQSLVGAIPGLMAPVIILGGLRSGLFTPTEAAVVAVFYGLIMGTLIYRNMTLRDVYQCLADSAETAATVMIIISLAGIFAWAGSTLGAFDEAAAILFTISDNGYIVLGMVMVLLLFAGMVLDGVSIYLITLPLLMPVMERFDWNPTWFGILMAMNIAIGQFTPPVAVNLMVTTKIANVGIESTVKWVGWFMLSMAIAMGLVILFPGLALWLPESLGYVTH
ncbi:TRAP transporter large permease [Cohaesibacter sp. CAU 1516]|nr:TRAP transporter large permease [Cohaesibacter sp. CAU 1516]